MSYCRPASEVNYLAHDWISPRLRKLNKGLSDEELVLKFRNGSIEAFMSDNKLSEQEKLELSDYVEDAREILIVNGFFRPEFMTLSVPELYFTLNYIVKLGLAEDVDLRLDEDGFEEVFLPYFMSNENYEEYVFCYERVESIVNLLANFLDEEELCEVAIDIMYMNDAPCDKEVLEMAKNELEADKEELIPLLEQVFEAF